MKYNMLTLSPTDIFNSLPIEKGSLVNLQAL